MTIAPQITNGFTVCFLDGDYRHDPKTNRFCTMCQKDIRGDAFVIHEVLGGNFALLLSESERYCRERPQDDLGMQFVGPECARRLPAGFKSREKVGSSA